MELRKERNVMMRRNGTIVSHSVRSLMVGDIILINQGEQLPVDAILISGSLLVDESSQTGEAKDIEKLPLDANPDHTENPFLLSGSLVKEGKGEAVVCAVGEYTRMGRIEAKLEEEPDPSPLQIKLTSIVVSISVNIYYVFIYSDLQTSRNSFLGNRCSNHRKSLDNKTQSRGQNFYIRCGNAFGQYCDSRNHYNSRCCT